MNLIGTLVYYVVILVIIIVFLDIAIQRLPKSFKDWFKKKIKKILEVKKR